MTTEHPTLDGLKSSRMRYKAMIPWVQGRHVIDYGCGLGYGTHVLSKYCRSVVGYDQNSDTIRQAKELYPELHFIDWSPEILSNSTVVLSEVLEHLHLAAGELLIASLRHSDRVIISTPNGNVFPYHPQSPNEFIGYHKWHYTEKELRELLERYYSYVNVSAIAYDERLVGEQWTGYLAIASNGISWSDSMYDEVK